MLNTSKFNALTMWGGVLQERRQALGYGLSPRRLPKGGQRRRGITSRLIEIGGDSYGK